MILYKKALNHIINKNKISLTDSILVLAGGPNDFNALKSFGFKNVTITNIAPHSKGFDYSPYNYQKADILNLDFEDQSYDWVFISAALHHLYLPHYGLCEMLRISIKGILVIESSDNFLSRLSRKLKLGVDYEIDALLNDGTGGVNNSHIPNFVYRWTKAEVRKTVNSFLPETKNEFHFLHNQRIPFARIKNEKNTLKKMVLFGLLPLLFFLKYLFPSQSNEFCFIVLKSKNLHPWLLKTDSGVALNKAYLNKNFKTNLK